MSCGAGCRHSLDPVWLWLWLWHRVAAAALIQPPAWELPYTGHMAKKQNKTKQKTERKVSDGAWNTILDELVGEHPGRNDL